MNQRQTTQDPHLSSKKHLVLAAESLWGWDNPPGKQLFRSANLQPMPNPKANMFWEAEDHQHPPAGTSPHHTMPYVAERVRSMPGGVDVARRG